MDERGSFLSERASVRVLEHMEAELGVTELLAGFSGNDQKEKSAIDNKSTLSDEYDS